MQKSRISTPAVMLVLALMAGLFLPISAANAQSSPDGRWVDFGRDWNGIIDCESEGHAQAVNRSSGAAGLFQFMQRTWDWVASSHGVKVMTGKDPRSFSAARQMKQAIRLKNMRGGGIRHWVCGYRYRDGTPRVWVTNEKLPKYPHKCKRRLIRKHGVRWKVAKSVCGVGIKR